MRTGIYPPELRSVNLDFDWFYRVLLVRGARRIERAWERFGAAAGTRAAAAMAVIEREARRLHGPNGILARTWPSGAMAFSVMAMLLAFLIAYYVF